MDEMLPFLRAIAGNPGDDTPRLVFADWLDEHKQPARAEFIRLQIELARMDPTDEGYTEKTARMRRCGVFTKKGKHRFFDYLPTKKCKIAFQRGFIESINTNFAEKIDTSGFDLIPLLALRTGSKLIEKFKGFTKLKWLEYFNGYGSDSSPTPAKLLEILGPKGWFKDLETLSLPNVNAACLEAGVIPQFDLPKLRNFFLSTDAFYNLGVFVESNSDQEDDYGESRSWSGLPDYLPKNAIPNKKSPLERFVWHTDDDSDFYRNGDRFWAGPTMGSLLTHLKPHKLKQVEVAVDWDDHECGGEGVIAASYEQNPLKLCPTLERVTLTGGDLQLLEGSTKKLKTLRVYASYDLDDSLFTILKKPVCSELESLHVEVRDGWGDEPTSGPSINFSKLKHLSGLLANYSNCHFPNLVSLRGVGNIKMFLEKKWPKLQCLDIDVGSDSIP
ncbi:MAG: TIGR02996 domain-containing protein, partial [Planctomycetia bacterium]|nr:TIGR02996 domain-containing protein [Planctomycetia bacterium]